MVTFIEHQLDKWWLCTLDLPKIMNDSQKYELMYRRPGGVEHENITDVLNDILIRLKEIEDFLEFDGNDIQPGLTD